MTSLSLACGLATGHIGLIVSGHVEDPRSSIPTRIAEVTGVSLDWLLRGLGEEPQEPALALAKERVCAAAKLARHSRTPAAA